jgi:hypothetical protein
MLHQVQQAIMPGLPLADAIENWESIAEGLAEPWRRRRPQIEAIMEPGKPETQSQSTLPRSNS